MESLLILIGRVLLGGFFLWKAAEKVLHWHETNEALRRKKIPYVSYILPVSMVFLVLGGLSVVLGVYARFGALLLLIYMVAHIYKLHAFWSLNAGTERTLEKLMFMKDLAIVGGLFFVLAIGSGAFSVHA